MARKKTQEKVIEEFIEVHGDRYDYSKVEYKSTNEKVIIICPEHGEFLQQPSKHKKGAGCGHKECKAKAISKGKSKRNRRVVDGVDEKKCPRCKQFLPLNKFGLNKKKFDGRQFYCKPCSREYVSERRKLPHVQQKRKDYRQSDKGRAAKRAWSKKNRSKKIYGLIDYLKKNNVETNTPYCLYHFKINDVYKFGVSQFGVNKRYSGECDTSLIIDIVEWWMDEEMAKNIEKILKIMTKKDVHIGQSPFRNTSTTEIKNYSIKWLIDNIISENSINCVIKTY